MVWKFIKAYDEGYAHRTSCNGADLSSGQRHRFLIARVFEKCLLIGNADYFKYATF